MAEIIYPPTIDWGWMIQRPQQIMLRMAAMGYKVHYFNITTRLRKSPDVISPNLTIYHSTFCLRTLPVRRPVLWISWPGHHDLASAYPEGFVIFDAVDDFPQWRPMVDPMLQKADIVLASSQVLFRHYSQRHEHVYLVRNGVDFDHFSAACRKDLPIPHDMLAIPKPIVGYVGAIGEWVDSELLGLLGRSGLSVVIVGPMFGGRLPHEDNVYYLGMKDYRDLPGYIRCFDVCIIPFVDNDITRATNPIKMYEYLAAGKPVVSTPVPEACLLSPAVRIARAHKEFVQAVWKSVRDPCLGQVERIALARSNSWDLRARQVDTIIKSHWPGGWGEQTSQ